jgi:hypothetical protein
VFFIIVHSVSDIDNLRSDDTSMLYHRSCYKTYTSRRNCGFFKVESAGSDHKPDTSQVPLLNEQTDDTSTDIALCIFCGKQTFKKDRRAFDNGATMANKFVSDTLSRRAK